MAVRLSHGCAIYSNQMNSLLPWTSLIITAGAIHAGQMEQGINTGDFGLSTALNPAKTEASEGVAKPEPIDFTVLASRAQRVQVVQPPPMVGLPPITGIATLKVEMVKAPALPAPVESLTDLPVQDITARPRIQEFQSEPPSGEFIFISATVYDHARTYLKILSNGQPEREVAVWSNVDFNHFTGVGSFRVAEADGVTRDIGLVMGLGNESGTKDGVPSLPDLATAGPSFVIVKGDSAEALKSVSRLHQLYRNEGELMKQAFLARATELEAAKAALLAEPPKPLDVTVRFWKRPEPTDSPSEQP